MTSDPRHQAWDALHEVLPPWWKVGTPTYDPGSRRWSACAVSGSRGHRKPPTTVTGAGETEVAALVDLHGRLTGRPQPEEVAARLEAINRRLRLAYFQGAEDAAGGRLNNVELERALGRYPGDVGEDRGPRR